jgi:uncharacterized protein (DUF58 family)
MVNQYNETTCQEVYILLNLEPEGMLVYDRLSEASISIAAGLSETLLTSGISVGILSNGVDYETKQPVVVYPQSEPEHIKDINTALARIDLKEGQESFNKLLESRTDHFNKSIFETSEGKGAMYVVISQNTRDEVQLAVNSLLDRDSQSVFIATHFRDKEVMLEQFAGEVIDWEVSHNAKG